MSWPRNGWLKGYRWALVDGAGDTLPDDMLHHLGVIGPGRRQLFSPVAQRLVAAGAETELREDASMFDVPEETFLLEAGRELRPDHTYRTTVVYENPTGEPAPHGGMGVIAGMAWTNEDDWPTFDADDSVYLADLWNTTTSPVRAARRPGGLGYGPLHGSPPGAVQDTAEWRRRLEADGDAWPEDVFGSEEPWASEAGDPARSAEGS